MIVWFLVLVVDFLDDNKRVVVVNGGLDLLIDIINTDDTKLQHEAVGCLRNLSMHRGFCVFRLIFS